MAKGKFTDPINCAIPMPGDGAVAENTDMLTKISTGLSKAQTDDGGATGEPYSTGSAKGAAPYGAKSHNRGSGK